MADSGCGGREAAAAGHTRLGPVCVCSHRAGVLAGGVSLEFPELCLCAEFWASKMPKIDRRLLKLWIHLDKFF